MTDMVFVDGAEQINDSAEILNWYRNLYHTENPNTERGLMARALNDILPEYVRQKAEIEALINGQETLQKHIAEKNAEIERLTHKCEDCAGCSAWKCDCSNIRNEALNTFWNKLKQKQLPLLRADDYSTCAIPTIEGDNLLREMTDFKE